MRRWDRVAMVTAALAAAGLALSSGLVPAVADTSPPPAPAPAVLPVLGTPTGPAPTPAGVRAQIGGLVRSALGDGSAVVIDPSTGTVLFDRKGARPRIPASVTKLTTAAAALSVLGPQTRLATVAAREGDTLYLVGGGDPTLVGTGGGNPLAGGSASLRDLARATAKALGETAAVKLVYDASAFSGPRLGPGWPASFPAMGVAAPVTALVADGGRTGPGANSRVRDPAQQAARVFAGLLSDRGVAVTSVEPGRRPEPAAEIARVESAPVSDIVERMLTDSENNYAEALAHLVGGAALGKPTFAGGAQAVTATLAELGIPTEGLDLADGSGLSSRNRIPALLLAALLTDAVQGEDPALAAIPPGLAVAGLTGTLADRFDTVATRPGRGVVHAKTGTLTGVVSLAGTVLDADGRVLVFVLMANNVRSLTGERDTMDLIASRLATCGCS